MRANQRNTAATMWKCKHRVKINRSARLKVVGGNHVSIPR